MAVTRRGNGKKGNIETIKIEGEGDKGQEVTVRYETVPQRKEKLAFSWLEESTKEWIQAFVRKKKKKI